LENKNRERLSNLALAKSATRAIPADRSLFMPNQVNADLPPTVRNHLPEHAQDIFPEAFNHAFTAHAKDPRQEEAAFRIAWRR
jgi:cation transport regulator